MMIIWPAAAMVLYIFIVGFVTVIARVNAFRSGAVKLGYYKTLDSTKYETPERLVILGRHYNNQFELPMLFLATCAICIALALNSALVLYSAWGFVLSRVLHGFIHLGSNHILYRMLSFMLGWIMLWLIWGAVLKSFLL